MDRKECLFIINPAGGSGKAKRQWEQVRTKFHMKLKDKYHVREKFTRVQGDATQICREAVLQGIECVVAVGGDGTTNEVANGFFDQGKPVWDSRSTPCPTKLAIVPFGTGSDLVRSIGWTRDLQHAIDRIQNGQTVPIDVGILSTNNENGQQQYRAFVNASTCGMGAVTCIHAKRYSWLPGPLAYYLAVATGLLLYRGQPVNIMLDGKKEQKIKLKDATLISVNNGQYFGGGMKVAPGASMNDGKMDIITVDQHNFVKFVMRGHTLRHGTYQKPNGEFKFEGITRNSASKINLESQNPNKKLLFEVDGEVWGQLPAQIDVIPNALQLVI